MAHYNDGFFYFYRCIPSFLQLLHYQSISLISRFNTTFMGQERELPIDKNKPQGGFYAHGEDLTKLSACLQENFAKSAISRHFIPPYLAISRHISPLYSAISRHISPMVL
jgi:hypothetical protein